MHAPPPASRGLSATRPRSSIQTLPGVLPGIWAAEGCTVGFSSGCGHRFRDDLLKSETEGMVLF